MYDFVSVKHVADLGTIIIEDLSCNEKVIVCDEHVPQLIEELKNNIIDDNIDATQWLVTYYYNDDIVKCLFSREQDAINYREYIDSIFMGEVLTTLLRVRVLPA